jgi:formate dehydrogenase subunit delta
MSPDKLARMANQIAAFFHAQGHDDAVAGVAGHINAFWEPRMRRDLLVLLDGSGDGLDPLVREARPLIRRPA